jgi:hypothetical protein
MRDMFESERGSALVAALFFILALTLTATVVVWVTSSERRISFNDYAHVRALYASDAGSEQAINWLRFQALPPPVVEVNTTTKDRFVRKDADQSTMHYDQDFRLDIKQKLNTLGGVQTRPRPGWDPSWVDFDYVIDSYGNSVSESNARVEVRAARLFHVDYAY